MVEPPAPNPQALAYLQSLPSTASLLALEIGDLRRELRALSVELSGEPEPVRSVQDVVAAGVPSRLYHSAGGERDVLVWLHGGGWSSGDPDCYDGVARALANRTSCAVLSVDYRLVPEHRHPAAIEDCWAATEWAFEHFDGVAVGGDSAGGNLAAAVALRARDRGLRLAFQLLVYPALDAAAPDGPFFNEFRARYDDFAGQKGYGATLQDGIRSIWAEYVPDASQRLETDVSPLRAPSLAGVATALIITAEHDILRGEGEDYARRLAEEGVSVELVDYPGQVHGFFHILRVMDDAHDAVDRSAAALRNAFGAVRT
jgi:acetyl esterase